MEAREPACLQTQRPACQSVLFRAPPSGAVEMPQNEAPAGSALSAASTFGAASWAEGWGKESHSARMAYS